MHAFTPGRIGRLEIKNRFVRAATSETMATESGTVTPALIELHQTLAANGVGLRSSATPSSIPAASRCPIRRASTTMP